ncbi:penicillin acylase family protein [Hymenobacter profundi]|uniref:Penicillin acylase family protein n=1 Tax=Hymenobacter profundi TaxID=1982110 RepID=A0ABS6X4D8_9BACT|nr:penicillin acylase family protein [Hymenobacter profundi]MBW3130585.1 penicillin acylase family protein [Hymenobacter profundi]
MVFRWIKFAVAFVLTIALTWVLHTSHGTVPPFGKFLSPYVGFWREGETAADFPKRQELALPALEQPVQVRFDDQRVAHVFAQNDHDLYYTQGYLTARDRLWQMDFMTHVAAGRLAEIVGPERLEMDRFFRRMGMVYGAQRSLDSMMVDPRTRLALTAYSDGVNAYINSLNSKEYPFEYKLLNYAPEPWEPLKSALLLKLMAFDLSGRSDDLRLSNALGKYGPEVVKDLFPDYPRLEDPIVPVGSPRNFTPVPVPPTPAGFEAAMSGKVPQHEPAPDLGSNNFAVGAGKSATGYPILANDPHLQLNLPSIWYQMQLSAPGVNVYGVSIPGAPTLIIGFNQDVAWGVTNTGADVMDWYQIKFRDATKREYQYAGRWLPVRRVVERIQIKGQPDRLDTVLYTRHGPIVYDHDEKPFSSQTPVHHALRWTAHDGANEVLTFYLLNRAHAYPDYLAALTHYGSPAQNFIFASNQKDIAIRPNGRFPLKWNDQGKFILDGTDSAYDWHGWIPAQQNPLSYNPKRGFVSSANQTPVGPEYPYYLGWQFSLWDRGHRINERLARMQRATPDSLRLLQLDNFGINAQLMLPRMLALVAPGQLKPAEQRVYQELQRWNFSYDADALGPSIYELWYNQLIKRIWEDDFGKQTGLEMRYPNRDRTNTLILQQPNSPWIDDKLTPEKETLPDLALQSFRWATDSLTRKFGPLNDDWHWANQKSTDILHLAQLPGFGHMNLNVGGGVGIVNAITERNGPSWRMVVALGPQPKAYGLFPGGQSGNPGSRYYDNMIDPWVQGKLPELVFLQKPNERNERIRAAWKLTTK